MVATEREAGAARAPAPADLAARAALVLVRPALGRPRLTLLDEYADDRVALLVYLGGLLHDAAGELHTLNPHDGPEPALLFHRFLGWALARPGSDRRATT